MGRDRYKSASCVCETSAAFATPVPGSHKFTQAHGRWGAQGSCTATDLCVTRFCTHRTPLEPLVVWACVCACVCETQGAKEQPAALCISSLIYQIPPLHYQRDHYPLSSLPSLPRFYWDSRWHNKTSTCTNRSHTHTHTFRTLITLHSFLHVNQKYLQSFVIFCHSIPVAVKEWQNEVSVAACVCDTNSL